jgi:hypothetical protein
MSVCLQVDLSNALLTLANNEFVILVTHPCNQINHQCRVERVPLHALGKLRNDLHPVVDCSSYIAVRPVDVSATNNQQRPTDRSIVQQSASAVARALNRKHSFV